MKAKDVILIVLGVVILISLMDSWTGRNVRHMLEDEIKRLNSENKEIRLERIESNKKLNALRYELLKIQARKYELTHVQDSLISEIEKKLKRNAIHSANVDADSLRSFFAKHKYHPVEKSMERDTTDN